MDDLTQKIARMQEIIAPALSPTGDHRGPLQKEKDATELLGIGVDIVADVVISARRIAVALEAIAAKDSGAASNLASGQKPFQPLSAKG